MDLAVTTIFVSGLLTFASPCVLPLIPIYLSVLIGGSIDEVEGGGSRFKLLLNGAFFVLGFLIVFTLAGLTASAMGRFLVTNRLLFQQLGGLAVFFFGLKFLGLVKMELLDREKRFQLGPKGRMGPISAMLIGLTFAFGWTPCIGPILGSILTFTAVSTDNMATGALYLLVYGLGIGLPLLLVAVFAQQGVAVLRRVQRFIPKLEKATGAVLVAIAVLMVTDNIGFLTFEPSSTSSADISQGIVNRTQRGPTGTGTYVARTDAGSQASTTGAHNPEAGASPSGAQAAQCGGSQSQCGVDTSDAFPSSITHSVGELTRGPVMLKFVQPNCPACLSMVPIMETLHQTCSGKGLRIETLDLSVPENKAVARQMGVMGTPTLIFFDEAGAEVSRLVGAQPIESLHQAVAVLMGEQCAQFSRLPL